MPQHQKPAILVVEDEAFIRMAAADTIEDLGFSPYEAGDAHEALSLLAEHPEIELMFSDVNMPGPMDGVALARRAAKERPDLGIILTSGKQRVADVPGGGTFLAKPYRPQQLAEVLERKIGRS